jgi:hypothetical protein
MKLNIYSSWLWRFIYDNRRRNKVLLQTFLQKVLMRRTKSCLIRQILYLDAFCDIFSLTTIHFLINCTKRYIHDLIYDLFQVLYDNRVFYKMTKYRLFLWKNVQKIIIFRRHYWLWICSRIVILFFQLNFQIFHENDEDFNILLTK